MGPELRGLDSFCPNYPNPKTEVLRFGQIFKKALESRGEFGKFIDILVQPKEAS